MGGGDGEFVESLQLSLFFLRDDISTLTTACSDLSTQSICLRGASVLRARAYAGLRFLMADMQEGCSQPGELGSQVLVLSRAFFTQKDEVSSQASRGTVFSVHSHARAHTHSTRYSKDLHHASAHY